VGGRNDSMALMMMDYIKKNQVFISFASDGHDNSESAGCIIDYNTKKEIKKRGLKIKDYKVCLDTYTLFSQTGNLLNTGLLESNVSDLMLLLTHKKNG
jgi:glycerate-2-kinase